MLTKLKVMTVQNYSINNISNFDVQITIKLVNEKHFELFHIA